MAKNNGIGIIGYGFVGKAIRTGFRSKCPIYINDPKYPKESRDLKTIAKNCSVIFVSVPTPIKKDLQFDDLIINGVMKSLNEVCEPIDHKERPVIVVKSAVVPSVVQVWENNLKNLRLVISPEYLSEKDGERMFVNQKLLILGGEVVDCMRVKARYYNDSICNMTIPIGYCTRVQASLLKYMENSFLAMKVVFMNQFFELYKAFGDDKDPIDSWACDVQRFFHYDGRMGSSHGIVPGPDFDYGFGGRCLPKDLCSIVSDARECYDVDLSLIEKAWEINQVIRNKRDWKEGMSK